MREDGLQFVVPWKDIKERLNDRARGAQIAVEKLAGKDDACNRGLREAADRDMALFALLAMYAPTEGTVELSRHQIDGIFMDQPHYGDNRIQVEASSEVRW